jgi:hypothetical protein
MPWTVDRCWVGYRNETSAHYVAHVIPRFDRVTHFHTPFCWCGPKLIDAGTVVVHHSTDGREHYE